MNKSNEPVVKIKFGTKQISYLLNRHPAMNRKLIENNDTLIFSNRAIRDISTQIRSSTNSAKIQMGVFPVSGNITIYDGEMLVKDLLQAKLITQNIEIEVYCGKEQIGKYYSTSNWKLSENSRVVEIEIKDILSLFDTISSDQISIKRDITGRTLLSLLQSQSNNVVYSNIGYNIEFEYEDGVLEYLDKFYFKIAYIEGSNLATMWDTFCYATLLIVYSNNGKIKIGRF